MLNRAEFDVGERVKYFDGKKLIDSVVTNVTLNPIDDIIEYRLFYRESRGNNGKRNRMFVTATPLFIEESKHFKGE